MLEIPDKRNLPQLQKQADKYAEYVDLMTKKIIEVETKDEYNSRLPELRQDLEVAKIKAESNKLVLEMATKFNPMSFLSAANPQTMLKAYSKVNTAKKALELAKIGLNGINKAFSAEVAELWISAFIFDLLKKVGITQTDDNVEFTATEIFEANKTLTTPEIALVFRRIATGYYGELYNKANALNICPIFKQYQTERIKALQEIEREKNTGKSMAGALMEVAKVMNAAPKTSLLHELSRKSKDKKLFKAPPPEKESLEIEALKSEISGLFSKMKAASEADVKQLDLEIMERSEKLAIMREVVQLKNAFAQTKLQLERNDLTEIQRVDFEESLSRIMDRLMELEG